MRKILFLSAFAISLLANAQTTEDSQESTSSVSERKNDIMLDPITLIGAPAINISYERLLSEQFGVGFQAIQYLGNRNIDDDDDLSFGQYSPYFRMYFGRKYAAGFFVEAFVPITTTKYYEYHYYSNDSGMYGYENREEKNVTTPGVGVGFGGKWLTRSNILFELSFGIARRFGNTDYTSDVTAKWMTGIGYRF